MNPDQKESGIRPPQADDAQAVVIVDDDAEMGAYLSAACTTLGYTPTHVTSVQHFLALDERDFGTAIIDLHMPDVDGIELLRMLADARADLRVLIVSGADARTRRAAETAAYHLGLHVLGALGKPVRVEQLERALHAAGRRKPVTSAESEAMLRDASDVRAGLERGEIRPHFQPKVDARTRQLCDFEALARWVLPEGEVLLPATFLPLIVAEPDLMAALTDTMVRESVDACRHWRAQGVEAGVSINASAGVLTDLDFPDRLADYAGRAGVPTHAISIEVTEAEVCAELDKILDVLARLSLKGFGLAIDDFGTGYATLAELRRVPCTELKIDRSFIADFLASRQAAVIVAKTIELAHDLDLIVCAEGVETDEAAQEMAELGCDLLQGYLFGRAMAEEYVVDFVEALQGKDAQDAARRQGL